MKTTLQIGIFFVCLIGCREQLSQPVMLEPYEQWRSFNLHNYSIDQVHSCFCAEGGQTMRITVRSDTVALV
ncbi:MAG TPA: DUF6174 domain-containing protein, partial [Candidatus Hodarchaeales archaeon]|nr:DUF6174 domain-containing protein [Candidatus Hodarchaeales archaeon]